MSTPRRIHAAVLLLAAAGHAAGLAAAVAQPPAPPTARDRPAGEAPDPRLDLLRGIRLAPGQRARIDSIDAAIAAEARRVEARSTSPVETVSRIARRADERRQAIRAVLRPAQRVAIDRNVEELRAWMRREAHH